MAKLIQGGQARPVTRVRPATINVFRNHTSFTPTKNTVVKQSKPNVGVYSWIPQVASLSHRTGPHERGSFFVNSARSGTGSVGAPILDQLQGDFTQNLVGLGDVGETGQQTIARIKRGRRLR